MDGGAGGGERGAHGLIAMATAAVKALSWAASSQHIPGSPVWVDQSCGVPHWLGCYQILSRRQSTLNCAMWSRYSAPAPVPVARKGWAMENLGILGIAIPCSDSRFRHCNPFPCR